MDRWLNRVAVVTGASSGIGAACCKDLVAKGMVVVGLARREERLQELKASLPKDQQSRFHGRKCDVSVEQQVIEAFAWIDTTLGGADVLVNNAGIAGKLQITDPDNAADLRAVLDTNVLGVSWCTREAFLSQQRRKVNDGHVVIINSIAGHIVPVVPGFGFRMYAPSKHAITALTEVLRQEFQLKKTQTKITSISPGVVDTEIIGDKIKEAMPMLRAQDIADAVTYT
ncbi:farnesol dehydrogenase-like [Drosophila guanche]|uniref:Blast:Dehydrogenase/reductase SDR family member 11 n=1 Tax=Drosophila guanche TaxID=7266 RepID=A0A3B0JCY9_DROGU|nr:farnesol dehydrogenase-like [Drosophila guanche]SPP80247.1 blast:Dehydrogenase/reductase SDR family member 11 [Drosophila guanche]